MNEANGQSLYIVKILTGSQAEKTLVVNRTPFRIGRDPQNELVLGDNTISRLHAQIVRQGSSWIIEKVAEQNTLRINNQDVQRGVLNPGDVVSLGPGGSFVFLTQQVQPSPQLTPSLFQNQPTPQPRFPNQPTPQPIFPSQPVQLTGNVRYGTERVSESGVLTGQPALVVTTNTSNYRDTQLLSKQVISIGRDPKNDIVIKAPVVSAFHALVERNGNGYTLVHPHPQARRDGKNATLNGLLYLGKHIRGDEPFRQTLKRGDIFRVGDANGTLVTLAYNDGSGKVQETLPEVRPIPLNMRRITIGRHPTDNIVLLQHPQVSGHHALIEATTGGHRITDQGSTNHTFINGQRVTTQLLKVNDEIRIGPFKLIYTGTDLRQYDESGSIRIDALQLQKMGGQSKTLLNNISLVIPPRKFIAVVGGSGAGKSTLMDALNGLRPADQGIVLYNGQDYYRSMAAFSTQLGYVPQDDIVHRDLTVERALYYAARLRLPDDFTREQISTRINEVLEDVDIAAQRGLLVHKLSGGQRKRVSIALELLANPSIFFLDEPTSGLDPGLDRKMMSLLRNLADRGHTIVLVTHATNNINSCDYVCFLASGGRLAYYGPPEEAKRYFDKTDFAEIYTELEPANAPAEAEARFRDSDDFKKYVAIPLAEGRAAQATHYLQTSNVKPARKRGGDWKQFKILSQRYIELLKNDTGNLRILLLQAPIIGLILMLILKFVTISGVFTSQNVTSPLHSGDAQKVLFVMSFAAVMFGCINGAREIVKELPIYRRERVANLGIVPYMFSKIVVLGVFCLLQSLVLVFMVNLVEPFHQGVLLPVGLEVYITVSLTSLAGLMVGLLISALAPNNDRAVSLIPLILIPQVIFAGTIFPLKSGPLQPLGLLFAVRWAMAALGTSLGLNSTYLGGDKLIGNIDTYQVGYDTNPKLYLLLLWLGLLVMIAALGFAIGHFLKKKDVKV